MSDALGRSVGLKLCQREWVRFLRQPARIAAAIGTPVLIWLLLGSGLTSSFRPLGWDEVRYGGFLLPGICTMVAVLSSVFSSISIIEDRDSGWLQAALVCPAPRWSIALGKILGGATLTWVQTLVLLLATPLVGLHPSGGGFALVALALLITCLAMTSLGLALAWHSESVSSFHGVMNLVLLPMWMFSSAMFPLPTAAPWLALLMRCNPLTWCTEAIRGPLLGEPWALPMAAAIGFAAATMAAAMYVIGRARG